jgi:hypothetical protein
VPHAGYIYSGQTAAYAYKQLIGKKYSTIFVLAPSHYFPFSGAAVYPSGEFQTPLGAIPLDTTIITEFAEHPGITINAEVFEREHALEVQLPFLQTTVKEFKFVPLLIGQSNKETLISIKEALLPYARRPDTLIVISTDLAHFKPGKINDTLDKTALNYISRNDVDGLTAASAQDKCEVCGMYPVAVSLLLAQDIHSDFRLLKHSNSGDTTGDYSQVVGYAAGYFDRSPTK